MRKAMLGIVAVPVVTVGLVMLSCLALWAWVTGNDPTDSTNADHPVDYR